MTSIAPRDGPLDGFNPAAAEAVNWTRKQLIATTTASGCAT